MKSIFTWLIAIAFIQSCLAQQPAQYSLYMFNKYAFNPAYAGMDNSLSLTAVYRKQWVGLEGSPETQALNVHMPLYFAGGGVGLALENESLGSWKQTMALATYDYQMTLSKGVLSIGVSAGLVQRQLDGSKVKTPHTIFDDEGNPINHQDVLLSISKENGIAPTFQAGVYFQGERLEAGLSTINLAENEIDLSTFSFKTDRTYYFSLGYRLDFGKSITLHPSVLIKSDVHQTQMDFSVLARYNENIFTGASLRGYNNQTLDAVALVAGFKLSEKITLGYSYDITLSNLNTVSNGSHEILVNYNLGKPIGKGRPPAIIYNPRSL